MKRPFPSRYDTHNYAWLVAHNGKVYGVYRIAPDRWYAGFSGTYP